MGRQRTFSKTDWDKDAAGYTTYFEHDGSGQIVYAGGAGGYGTYYRYALGWPDFVSARTDALGNTRYWAYDSKGGMA